MTSTARDVRYGRRGGGWAEAPVDMPAELPARRGGPVDLTRLRHPDVIADDRARARRGLPDPADHAAVWAGRARMAAARRDAGVYLDPVDRQALALTDRSTPR